MRHASFPRLVRSARNDRKVYQPAALSTAGFNASQYTLSHQQNCCELLHQRPDELTGFLLVEVVVEPLVKLDPPVVLPVNVND